MKFNLKLAQLSCILLLSSLVNPIAKAQTAIEATPSSLMLSGTRCLWGDCTQNQVLSIRTNQPIAQLEVVALPLSGDNGRNIPSALFPEKPSSSQVPANRVVSIPFKFDPDRLPSGEYKGDLLLTYQGGVQRIPVVIQVKDSWLPPLLTLLTGVILGVIVSAYREQGQPRDQIILRIGQLRTQLLGDPELDKAIAFQEWIQDHLIDVETAIQRRQFSAGDAAIGEAETLWIKWRKGREDWLKLMVYRDDLTSRVMQLGSNDAFGQTAIRQIDDVVKNMPLLEGPDKLRDQLEAIAKQVYLYAQLVPKITKLNQAAQSLPADELPPQTHELQNRIARTHLINLTDTATLQTRLEDALKEMLEMEKEIDSAIAQLPEAPVQRGMEKVGRGGGEMFTMPFAIAPAARPLSLEQQIQQAGVRLRLFLWTSYAIAVVFLAGAGFVELYADKPKFGAAPWRDYFALLAWGFGAEAARDAVTKTVKNWQLPGMRDR
jgi:hypothetical protein